MLDRDKQIGLNFNNDIIIPSNMEGSPFNNEFDNTFSRQYTYPIDESIDLDAITSYEIPNVMIVKRDLINYLPAADRTEANIDSLKLDLETTLRDIPGVNITDVDFWYLEIDQIRPDYPNLFEITLIIEYGDAITNSDILNNIDTRLSSLNILLLPEPSPDGGSEWETLYTQDSSLCDEGYVLDNDECILISDTR